MSDNRSNLLKIWLNKTLGETSWRLEKINSDASFRRYFRIKTTAKTYIAMDAPPDIEDAATFVKIAKILQNNLIKAPQIIADDLTQGFLLLQDFGDQTFLQTQQQELNPDLYKIAIDTLITIQTTDTGSIPAFDEASLKTEMQLFIDWYLPKNTDPNLLAPVFDFLCENALSAPQVFVHRDYHSRNLMVADDLPNLGVLDFQDAVCGSFAYDLVSLLKDAYFELSDDLRLDLLLYYHTQSQPDMDFIDLIRHFELMGMQRHLKVLGIFTRLAYRDGKSQYLDSIPQVLKNTLEVAEKYPELHIIKALCVP